MDECEKVLNFLFTQTGGVIMKRLGTRVIYPLMMILVLVFLLLKPWVAEAQSFASSESSNRINKENLEKFFDEFAKEQMKSNNISGVLTASVLDGEMIFSRGYGYANIAENKQMDPSTSVFRAASLSKLFTATAIHQLAEKGLVDLNTDINKYLGDLIPKTYSQPITLAHLLTHTAGFDELNTSVRFSEPGMVSSLREDVVGSMPPRIREPGKIISYSNYGYSLAGYIVEVVTGMTFEEYVQKNILEPLDMDQSTFYEPPSKELKDNLVTMYSYRENQYVPLPPLYHNQRPAGALYSNIEDLANFMIAQLNDGTYKGKNILNRESIELMQRPQFLHHPELEGWGYGLYELSRNGLPIIGHGGDLNGAYTLLFLIPDINFGMVFHYNTSISAPLEADPRILLYERFIDTFYPEYSLNTPLAKESIDKASVTDVSGYYRFTRYAHNSPGKLLMPMILAQLIVTQDSNSTVNIRMPLGMIEDTKWVPYGKDLFRQTDKETYLAYQKDDRGQVEYLFFTNGGAQAIERVPWHERFWVILFFVGFSQLLFLSITIEWLVRAIVRRLTKRKAYPLPPSLRLAKDLTRGISISGIIIAGVVGVMASHVMATLNSPLLIFLPLISLMGWLMGIGSIALIVVTIGIWRNNEEKIWHRIIYLLSAFAGLCFTWVLYYGNMLWFTTL